MTTPNGGFDLSNVDMNGLLAQAQAMQAQLAQAQQQLESTTFDGSAGGCGSPAGHDTQDSGNGTLIVSVVSLGVHGRHTRHRT